MLVHRGERRDDDIPSGTRGTIMRGHATVVSVLGTLVIASFIVTPSLQSGRTTPRPSGSAMQPAFTQDTEFFDAGPVTDSGTPAAVVTIESPNPDGGSVYQTATTPVVVSGTATGVATGFTWAPMDAGSTACTNDSGTNFACSVDMYVDAGIGNQVFVVTATGPDENGTDEITMDWQPAPTITITSPGDDPHEVTANTLTVSGTMNGDVRTISGVTWHIVDAGTTTACDTDAGTAFACSTTGLVQGDQTVVTTATGAVANGTDTVVVSRVIAPVVTISSPNSGNAYDPPTSTISVSGTIANTSTSTTWNYADAGTTACATDAGAYFDCNVTSLPSTATRVVTITSTNVAGSGTDTQTFGPAPPGAPVLLYSPLYETSFANSDPVGAIDNKGSKTDADLTQTGAARPTYLTPCTSTKMVTTGFSGGAPCFSFGGSQWISSGAFAAVIAQPARVLTVVKFTSLPASTNGIVFDNSSGTGSTRWLGFEDTSNFYNASAGVGRTSSTAANTTTYRSFCAYFNTTSSQIFINGTSESTGNMGTNTQGSWTMGGRFDGSSQNSFSEIFMQGVWVDGTTCANLESWVDVLFTSGIPQ